MQSSFSYKLQANLKINKSICFKHPSQERKCKYPRKDLKGSKQIENKFKSRKNKLLSLVDPSVTKITSPRPRTSITDLKAHLRRKYSEKISFTLTIDDARAAELQAKRLHNWDQLSRVLNQSTGCLAIMAPTGFFAVLSGRAKAESPLERGVQDLLRFRAKISSLLEGDKDLFAKVAFACPTSRLGNQTLRNTPDKYFESSFDKECAKPQKLQYDDFFPPEITPYPCSTVRPDIFNKLNIYSCTIKLIPNTENHKIKDKGKPSQLAHKHDISFQQYKRIPSNFSSNLLKDRSNRDKMKHFLGFTAKYIKGLLSKDEFLIQNLQLEPPLKLWKANLDDQNKSHKTIYTGLEKIKLRYDINLRFDKYLSLISEDDKKLLLNVNGGKPFKSLKELRNYFKDNPRLGQIWIKACQELLPIEPEEDLFNEDRQAHPLFLHWILTSNQMRVPTKLDFLNSRTREKIYKKLGHIYFSNEKNQPSQSSERPSFNRETTQCNMNWPQSRQFFNYISAEGQISDYVTRDSEWLGPGDKSYEDFIGDTPPNEPYSSENVENAFSGTLYEIQYEVRSQIHYQQNDYSEMNYDFFKTKQSTSVKASKAIPSEYSFLPSELDENSLKRSGLDLWKDEPEILKKPKTNSFQDNEFDEQGSNHQENQICENICNFQNFLDFGGYSDEVLMEDVKSQIADGCSVSNKESFN